MSLGPCRLLWAGDDQSEDIVPMDSSRLQLRAFDGNSFLVPFDGDALGKGSESGREALTSGDRSLRMSAGGCGLSGRGSLISNK